MVVPRIILLPELAAGFGCFLVARRKIAAVKNADNWFAGLRQTVVTDTSWRTDPPRFPVRWLIPALAVTAATVTVGALRYPGLPAYIVTGSGHRVPKSAVSLLIVAGQLYFTAVYSGLMLIVHRSRPDIEAADPAASTLRYRRFLAAFTRALLTMAALADLGLLLFALPDWQVYRLSGIGRALPVLPFAAGVLLLGTVAARTGQGGSRLNGNVRGLAPATGTDRDDDRFWKAACSTSTATTPPSWSAPVSASAGRPTSATGPRGCSSPGPSPRGPAWRCSGRRRECDQALTRSRPCVTGPGKW